MNCRKQKLKATIWYRKISGQGMKKKKIKKSEMHPIQENNMEFSGVVLIDDSSNSF